MLAQSVWFGPVAGLAIGVFLGFAARWGRFCTLSALERYWYGGDGSGIRGLMLAAGVATLGAQALDLAGVVDLRQSLYLAPSFNLLGAVLGGLMFGFGMALVGACGFSALIQLGGGSLRALVALTALGLTALATAGGVLAPLRLAVESVGVVDLGFAGDASMGALASAALGVDLRAAAGLALGLAMVGWALSSPAYRAQRQAWGGALAVGLVVPMGWLITSLQRAEGFDDRLLESISFVRPVGELVLTVVAYTGVQPSFGAGVVTGVALGAALAAWRRHDMRWEACDDARELSRHLGGAALMGFGGMIALGCTVGQGLSAFSALAVSAPITIFCIAVGARLGLAWLLEGSVRHAFRAQSRAAAE
jgi:uncharacterized membrane protein YedE/YeeE